MKVLLIRHAAAVEPGAGGDLERKLSAAGLQTAREVFRALARFYAAPDLIVSSEAVRAVQTADELAEVFPRVRREISPLLNPGCDAARFRKLIRHVGASVERLAVVGHEPDLSHIVASVAAEGGLQIEVQKAACIELDLNPLGRGVLTMLLPPVVLGA